ncbi:MAG: Fe-S oxidoreductase, partial [Flavobacteriaceae bacterium]
MSTILSSILFLSVWIIALFVLFKNANKLKKAINQGQGSFDKSNSSVRWTQMLKVAFGQSKMGSRPIAAMLHLIVYIGFFVVNIELIEILIDGLFGTHRILNQVLGSLYNGFTATLEV